MASIMWGIYIIIYKSILGIYNAKRKSQSIIYYQQYWKKILHGRHHLCLSVSFLQKKAKKANLKFRKYGRAPSKVIVFEELIDGRKVQEPNLMLEIELIYVKLY